MARCAWLVVWRWSSWVKFSFSSIWFSRARLSTQPKSPSSMRPSLIVHGGAWNIPDEAVDACRTGCRQALEFGWRILESSGTALDAVEAAIVALEDAAVFDAGIGSHLNLDGRVELDAMIMDGTTLKAGAVAVVE